MPGRYNRMDGDVCMKANRLRLSRSASVAHVARAHCASSSQIVSIHAMADPINDQYCLKRLQKPQPRTAGQCVRSLHACTTAAQWLQ